MTTANIGVSEVTVSAVIIRADGTKENLGVIARSKPTRWQRLLNFVKRSDR
jgi:hypothetical protein